MASVEAGDFRVTLVRAGIYRWDAGAVFGVVPKTLWRRHVEADEENRVAFGFNCYIVETGAHTALIETGCGDKMDHRARERMAFFDPTPLPETIAAHGIDPERIDLIINSHLHWDHCGWNTTATGAPMFPRAAYFAPKGEWEHAHERHPRDSVSYLDLNYDPLVKSGQMRLIDGPEYETAPGIKMLHAPGHNRDMRVVTAESNGRTFCFFSDLVPSTVHLPPTWVAAFDLFPLESIDNKKLLLTRAARENWICGFGHDPGVAFARIAESNGRFSATAL